MWNKIESYINTHREELDIEVPGAHVWEGIENQLDVPAPKSLWKSSFQYWKTAAVILLGVGLAAFWLKQDVHPGTQSDIIETQIFPHGIDAKLAQWPQQEVEYESNIQELLKEVRTYNPDKYIFMGPYMEDVARLDRALEELQDAVKEHSLDERLMNSLSSTYQKKIDLLNELLKELKESNP
ncbi:MAG: hypothetical protein AAF587_20200 [Bacteroidota bacterium]